MERDLAYEQEELDREKERAMAGSDAYSRFKTQCRMCRHIYSVMARTCSAFPQGIPDDIWLNRFDHTKTYPGDHGIRFELFGVAQNG